jgi:hypothetical protein
VLALKESLKISKTFVCKCGNEYSLELSTDLALENMLIEASCPSCGEKRTITAGSLLVNRPSSSQAASASSSSSDSAPSLSFMDSLEESASSSGESSYSSSDAHLQEQQEKDINDSIYSDMFGSA